MRPGRGERGAALPLAAAGLFMLMMAAAWAVDVSSFYGTLRSDQTIADLACLAGASQLPGSSAAAIEEAAAITRVNWPVMDSAGLTIGGDQGVMSNAAGDRVVFSARHGGDSDMFRVSVTAVTPTSFGQVAGLDSVDLRQLATCSGGDYPDRGETVPFGALVGGFTGGLFAPNPCGSGSGNCGSLFIDGESNSDFIDGTGNGVDVVVTPSADGPGIQDCRSATPGTECDIVSTNTGVSASTMGAAFLARFDEPVHECQSWVRAGDRYNCDTLAQVLGGAPATLVSVHPTRPAWWDTSLYGAYTTANTTNHYYWNQPVAHCDSPRLVTIPIVAAELDWELGDPATGWPAGKKDMKVVGIYDVILIDPDSDSDFNGANNLKRASAAIIWFGPQATCWDGRLPIGTLNGADGHPDRLVRLEPNT